MLQSMGLQESDMTEQLNNYNIMIQAHLVYFLPHSLNHPFLQEILVILHPDTKIWGMVKDREDWYAAIHRAVKSWT